MSGTDDTRVIAIGEVVDDRYRIIERLGEGGVGTVYRVEHLHIAKEMAMKLLRAEVSAIPEVQERFEREAQSAARLDDPRIVRVTDFGRNGEGSLYLVMELVDGVTLSTRLREGMTIDETLRMIDELLAGLEHAHTNDVIHRDLKPDNVMLVKNNGGVSVKILDFGLAKITGSGKDAPLTRAGMVFGTPRYMAPEQAAGDPADHRADLYAVGVILFEALTGAPPFTGDSAMSVLMAHINTPPPPLVIKHGDDKRLEQLSSIVTRALTKDAGRRYQSAAEFRAALRAVETVEPHRPVRAPVSSPAVPAPTEASEFIRPDTSRRPLLLIGAVVSVVLIGLAMMVGGGPETVEAALDRGDVAAARAAVTQLEADHPRDPTTFLAVGQVALAENDPAAAREAFRRALELDHDIGAEFRFAEEILRRAKTDIPPAPDVIADVAKNGGLGSVPFLVRAFEATPSAAVRRRAYAGLERLDGTSAVDGALVRLIADLKATEARDCPIRRWYVNRILRFDEPVARAALRYEATRKGPLGRSVNDCFEDELTPDLERAPKPE